MPYPRTLIGLSVGSGLEGIDVAVVRAAGIGLNLEARVERAARLPFSPLVRELIRPTPGTAAAKNAGAELTRLVAEAAAQAVRTAAAHSDRAGRDALAVGAIEPQRYGPAAAAIDWPEVADRVADQTGLTVVHGFRGRDRAGGGAGHPIAAGADYLLHRDPAAERVLVHLGAVASVVWLPGDGGRVGAVQGFDAGPCNRLLDGLLAHATRGREAADPGGKRAVQGCCLDALLARWVEHPFLGRKPPRTIGPEPFGPAFVAAAFDAARRADATLPDLLCTATHLVARAVGEGVRRWLPAPAAGRRVFLSGGGTRNGFLRQLLAQQFDGPPLARLDELGTPALGRGAAGAAVLAALLLDGVPGNLPFLTGATAARPCGHLSPGEVRNWARCVGWIAEHSGHVPRLGRAG